MCYSCFYPPLVTARLTAKAQTLSQSQSPLISVWIGGTILYSPPTPSHHFSALSFLAFISVCTPLSWFRPCHLTWVTAFSHLLTRSCFLTFLVSFKSYSHMLAREAAPQCRCERAASLPWFQAQPASPAIKSLATVCVLRSQA